MDRRMTSAALVWTILQSPWLATSANAQRANVDVVSAAHARGIVVLRASFPTRGALHSFGFEISVNGEAFVNAKAGPTRGLRFTNRMIRGSDQGDETVLVAPLVGRFDFTPQGFLFDTEGKYYLRWDIAFKDREVGDLKVEQAIHVAPPLPADQTFLARIGDASFTTDMFGFEPPEAMSRDSIALGVVAFLLEYAQEDPGEEGFLRGELRWADALIGLAKELPTSSYSPYAAFVAGRIYHGHLGLAMHSEFLTAGVRRHKYYGMADDALDFAVQRGDDFLKPRALCALGYLRICGAAWEDADQALLQAASAAEGQGTILAVVKKTRAEIPRLKKQQLPQSRNDAKDR